MRHPGAVGVALALALAGVAFVAAGCGGGSPSGVASVASSTAATTTAAGQNGDALVAFARCMRSNGVASFPDPQNVGGKALKLQIHRLGTSDAHFQAAQRACNHLLPNGGPQDTTQDSSTHLAGELSFAKCMRSHGVSNFPDPTPQGSLPIEMVQAHGVDVHSPAVLRVVRTCLPASHGALTPAKVREALRKAG